MDDERVAGDRRPSGEAVVDGGGVARYRAGGERRHLGVGVAQELYRARPLLLVLRRGARLNLEVDVQAVAEGPHLVRDGRSRIVRIDPHCVVVDVALLVQRALYRLRGAVRERDYRLDAPRARGEEHAIDAARLYRAVAAEVHARAHAEVHHVEVAAVRAVVDGERAGAGDVAPPAVVVPLLRRRARKARRSGDGATVRSGRIDLEPARREVLRKPGDRHWKRSHLELARRGRPHESPGGVLLLIDVVVLRARGLLGDCD